IVDIGFPPPDPAWPVLVSDLWAGARLPRLAPTMHKGDRGRVTVVGGSNGMTGAALHTARAALAAGAGLVKLVAAQETIAAARASLPDVLTVESALGPELEADAADALEWADAVVVGPGLGREPPRTPGSPASSARSGRAAAQGPRRPRSARTPWAAPPSTAPASGPRAACGPPTCSPRSPRSGEPGRARSRPGGGPPSWRCWSHRRRRERWG